MTVTAFLRTDNFQTKNDKIAELLCEGRDWRPENLSNSKFHLHSKTLALPGNIPHLDKHINMSDNPLVFCLTCQRHILGYPSKLDMKYQGTMLDS